MKRMRPHHRREGGYMLLTVLFMAALVIITLGISLPREAFEGQRQREEELVYRGGQYSRAVQLYFRKFKRYPSDLENLEKSNNVRFLRRKYVDPITKESEWRIIHVGPGGTFTDSLVYDRPKPQTKDGMTPAGTPTTPETPGGPQSGIPGQPQITGMADRLRALGAGQTATPDQPGGVDPNNPGDPNNPQQQQQPPQQYFVAGQPGAPNQPGQTGVQAQIGGQPFQPGMPGAPPGFPAAQAQTGFGQQSGFGGQQGFGGGFGQQPSGNPGQPGFGQAGFGRAPGFGQQTTIGGQIQTPGGPAPLGSDAARLLGQLLTTPRPGGLAGIQAGMQAGGAAAGVGGFGGMGGMAGQAAGGFGGLSGMAGQPGGAGFGGGIAGVASNSKARGIKVVNERENYNEWEFVYDYRKDPLLVGGAAAGMGGMAGQQQGAARSGAAQTGFGGSTPASSFGQSGGFGQTTGAGAPTGFGQPGGFGQPANSGFGTPGTGQPGFGQPAPAQPGQPGFIPPGQVPVNPSQPGLGPGLRGLPTPIITPDNPIPPPPPPAP